MKSFENSQSMKLFDSELRVMKLLWKHGELTAKRISELLADEVGWNVNTSYTVIKKCIAKGAIERSEPNFVCRALVGERETQDSAAAELIDKLYDGAADKLVAGLIDSKRLTPDEIERLKLLVEELE